MAGPPAFQFYASDWAHSVSAMTLEERGAYITLLAWSWEHGPVPNDLKRITAILGTHVGAARRLWAEVSKKWALRGDGSGWINARLERVRAEQDEYQRRQSAKGRAGAEARKAARAVAQAPAQASAQALTGAPTERQPDGQPEASPPYSTSDLQPPLRQERSEWGEPRAREDEPPTGGVQPGWRKASERTPQAHGLAAGASRHGLHAWCCDRELCVPLGLHAQFKGRLVGDHRDERLEAFYAETIAAVEGIAVGDNLFKFWEKHFEAWAGTVTTRPSGSRTGDTVDAGKAYLREKFSEFVEEEHRGRALKG